MEDVKKSRYGVYYDLSISPYEFTTPYGDSFKFRSRKKLEMYRRDLPSELKRLDAIIDRNNMRGYLTPEIIDLLRKTVYRAFYKKIEG